MSYFYFSWHENKKVSHLKQFFRIMRISSFLLIFCTFVMFAEDLYSQKARVTIKQRNVLLEKVLNEIENQTDYLFLYNGNQIDVTQNVSVNVKNMPVNQLLSELFSASQVKYVMEGTHIVLLEKGQDVIEMLDVVSQQITITGKVTDAGGQTMTGVTVSIKGTTLGVVCDPNGKYSITVPNREAVLVFSSVGYVSQEVLVGDQITISLVLRESVKEIDEVVVVGYGTQRKMTLTGSVSSIKGSELVVTKNENVQNMLTGKIPGVRVWQRTAEPGAFNMRFDIRGFGDPLIVIDGITKSIEEFQRLSPNDIEDISVLKDGTAAIYGVRAANGVIMVTTKKGSTSEKAEVNYSGSFTFQFPLGLPDVVNAHEYMTIRNWAGQNNKSGTINLPYNEQDFEDFSIGKRKDWNWNEYILNKFAPQTQHSLSVTGGNERTTYYIAAGYLYQNSFFKGNDRNYDKYNVLSNLSTKLYENWTFDLSLSAIIDERDEPNESAVWTIRDYWRMNPIVGPYADVEETMVNHDVTETENPLSMIYSDLIGSRQRQRKWFDATASLKWDVPWIKGLNIKGLFGYNYNYETYTQHSKKLTQYSYNPATEVYSPGTASRYNIDRFRSEIYFKTQMTSQFIMNFNRDFGLNHIESMIGWESMWRNRDNMYAQRDLLFPGASLGSGMAQNQQGDMSVSASNYYFRNNNALLGRLKYSFDHKYLAEFIFRYDGSSNFAPGYQWGFFPSISVGWRLSEEDFFKNLLPNIQQLKLRASYGLTGDDTAGQYQFMDGFNYPVSGSNSRQFAHGHVFDGNWVQSAANRGISNKYITWYQSKSFNLAVDFEAWNGLFGFTLEYFNREREGLLTQRTGGIPTVIGAQIPEENINGDRNFGIDLELTHRNQINDLLYRVSLIGYITRHQRLYWEERSFNSSRDRWLNGNADRLQGGWFTDREADGQFQSWDDIWNYPVHQPSGNLPGSYKYLDWNGDGEISGYDRHRVGYANGTPWVNFSCNLSAAYKGFDLSVLFQGSAFGTLQYGEQLRGESQTLRAMLDRWHPTDPNADPYDPNTQWIKGFYAFNPRPDDNSSHNVVDNSYLRLKNVELGYNLPAYKSLKTRVYVGGYNVFTITKVRNMDPENPGNSDSWGFNYPSNRTLTFGLTVKF